jgi:hypothetical protein
MKKNEGYLDRVLRITLGLGVISLIFIGPQTIWGVAGAIPLLTGLIGWCPLYSLLGINTCPIKKSSS